MRQMIVAAMVAFAGLTGPVLAKDTPPPRAPTAAAPAAPPISPGRRKYQSIFPVNTPKAVLDPLKAEEGVWTADVELYVGDPAKQPIRKTGVQTNRLVSKGNAIINEFAYDDGSYAGTGMWGWDAYTNRYTGTWIDSDTHLVRHDIGYYDPDARVVRWEADTMQPDGVTTRMRIRQEFQGDVRLFQIDVMDAKTGEFKKLIMMRFTRRKA